MITAIRRQFKSSGHRFVLWIIIIALAAGVAPTFLRRATGGGPWAVKVNSEEISYQEFVREVSNQRDRIAFFRAQYGQIADLLMQSMGMSFNPKTLAFDQLVKEELLNQFAHTLGLYLHSDYIMQKMNDKQFVQQHLAHIIPPYLFDKSNTINVDSIKIYLKQQGLSTSMFEHTIERALARQQAMELVTATFYIPMFEVKQQYITDNASKKFTLFLFSFADFLKKEKEKKVTDVMLKTFFDKQNRQFKRYWVPEKRSGMHWKFEPRSYDVVVTQEEIAAYYEEKKTKKFVKEPIKVQVRQILIKNSTDTISLATVRQELLKNPSTFADRAKELSQDPASAKNGGLLEPFARGQKEQAFGRAAFLLKDDGVISRVINTSEGEVLLQRVKKIKQTYQSFASVENEIKKILMEQRFKEKFAQDMKHIIENKNGNEQLLKELVAKKGGNPASIDPIVKGDTKIAQTLFKLKEGDIDFYVENNIGIAVQLTAIHDQYLPAIESIQSAVQGDFYEERASDALRSELQQVTKAAKNKSFSELQKEFGVNIEEIDWIKPNDTEGKKKLEKRGLPVTKMMQLDSIGMTIGEQPDRDGYLVHLDEIRVLQKEQDKVQWDKARDRIKRNQMNLYEEAFVASLYRHAKIEVNESVIIADEEYSV